MTPHIPQISAIYSVHVVDASMLHYKQVMHLCISREYWSEKIGSSTFS